MLPDGGLSSTNSFPIWARLGLDLHVSVVSINGVPLKAVAKPTFFGIVRGSTIYGYTRILDADPYIIWGFLRKGTPRKVGLLL